MAVPFAPKWFGAWDGAPCFTAVICTDCGHTLFFADKATRAKARRHREWKHHEQPTAEKQDSAM